jgi:hypothetical protein
VTRDSVCLAAAGAAVRSSGARVLLTPRGLRVSAARRRLRAGVVALVAAALTLPSPPRYRQPPPRRRRADCAPDVRRHLAAEARRVDSVPTPKLAGTDVTATPSAPPSACRSTTTAEGRDGRGGRAARQGAGSKRRIGSLFLNPGGPGGSGTQIAYFAPAFLDRTAGPLRHRRDGPARDELQRQRQVLPEPARQARPWRA